MTMEPLSRLTSLSRAIDPRLKNHQLILGLSVLAGAACPLIGWFIGSTLLASLLLGVKCGISAFLTWVLARELDPDHPNSGLLGPLLIVPAVLAIGSPSLLSALWTVMLLRILNRSTGLPATPPDSMGTILLTAVLSTTLHPSLGILGGTAFLADSLLPRGHAYHRGLGVFTLAIAAGHWWFVGGGFMLPDQIRFWIGVGLASLLFLLTILWQDDPVSVGDYDGQPLSESRVNAAQYAALIVALFFILFEGRSGFQEQTPLWAALVGVAGYQFVRRLLERA